MAKNLVIVESPAKAKTIEKYLGSNYKVLASVGHVRDLPRSDFAIEASGDEVALRYEVPKSSSKVVTSIRKAAKTAEQVFLATDLDREGEAIAWHVAKVANIDTTSSNRVVFSEITRDAVLAAFDQPRRIDQHLVDAQQARRAVDRIVGYRVSPTLWRNVASGISAGRVQSVALRMIVDREDEIRRFLAQEYWSLHGDFDRDDTPFASELHTVDGQRITDPKKYDEAVERNRAGKLRVIRDADQARELENATRGVEQWTVTDVTRRETKRNPAPPFTTSTLQQEAERKLGYAPGRTMRIAQQLYEGIALGTEGPTGLISYMRTDSTNLSNTALGELGELITTDYGQRYALDKPRRYSKTSKNAQEAHEAIRPTTPLRLPQQVRGGLDSQEMSLCRMIWQRTLASQMADATGTTVTVRLGATATDGSDAAFGAAGTTITFPGYRQVYVESRDEGDTDDEREALLPPLANGDVVPVAALEPQGHATSPPARYTEAALIKRLEELEIGRPSTWASIIQTVQDRGYVWKKGQALVPTWTAFAVVNLLEQHFDELVDYDFTAKIDDDLDLIAAGRQQKEQWLQSFYFGDGQLPGLKRLVEENLGEIDAATINTFSLGTDDDGNEVVVKPGRYGPYVKRGEDTAGVPEELAPDELTLATALELLAAPRSDEPIGQLDGFPVFAKNGRYGPYVQWGSADDLPPGLEKPKMASLFKTMVLERITLEEAAALLRLPRRLGEDPADGVAILANNGRYGPYVQKDKDYRNIDNEERLLTITLDEAVEIFSQPKVYRRGNQNLAAKGPLREFGTDPVSERPVVAKDGKFGVYVTDGETNASIGKGDRIDTMAPERAYELLAVRREQVAAKGGVSTKRPARKAPAKKAAAKSKKAAAPRKAAARKR
ncbi:MAG: type I DNA topoisomerase [Euzebya sp.]